SCSHLRAPIRRRQCHSGQGLRYGMAEGVTGDWAKRDGGSDAQGDQGSSSEASSHRHLRPVRGRSARERQ
ncbi:hypothetical protein B8W90_14375, partial [Staphylococcus hominis]